MVSQKMNFTNTGLDVHAKVAVDFMMRHEVVEFRQYHTTPETKALGEAMAEAVGRPMLSFDGMSDAYVKDWKTCEDAFKDPKYLEEIRPDELAFIDVQNLQMTIGYDYCAVENGAKIAEHARGFQMSSIPQPKTNSK